MQHEHIYFSVKMRAAQGGSHEQGGRHISGGERIVPYHDLSSCMAELAEKGLNHSRGKPDFMNIQFEQIEEAVKYVSPLPVGSHVVSSVADGQATARSLLTEAGIEPQVIEEAYHVISQLTELRGALFIDVATGQRLDDSKKNGVRVSRMDWRMDDFSCWSNEHQISPNIRMKEALTLATKVTQHPATIAELCWSDDPDYVTGYVASKKLGYQRISQLKELGQEKGCRIFFVDQSKMKDLDAYINYLTTQPVLIRWKQEVMADESRSMAGRAAE
ncbi:6-carboxyhexanoate--CoA ligase [Alkalihalophilus marmarensis]|uniref:6-carboxyhexanoate--CoA ligase n=1 Tax=Alkalihalophilus marmarensis TaxID=521377 RepID=UPI002E244F52|nr:6-carboxyhexanoate--CoA ligase [Alkalihalophilus marmarensis]